MKGARRRQAHDENRLENDDHVGRQALVRNDPHHDPHDCGGSAFQKPLYDVGGDALNDDTLD